jgi:hypothetical protein
MVNIITEWIQRKLAKRMFLKNIAPALLQDVLDYPELTVSLKTTIEAISRGHDFQGCLRFYGNEIRTSVELTNEAKIEALTFYIKKLEEQYD